MTRRRVTYVCLRNKTNGTKYTTHPYGAPSSLHYKKWRKQKTLALNNKKREKAKSTQKKQKHTYLIDGRTYISNSAPTKTSGRLGQLGRKRRQRRKIRKAVLFIYLFVYLA